MRRACARELCGQIREVNGMGIESIETDHRAGRIDHYIKSDVVRLCQLVGSLLKIVVDLFDAARKSRSIMSLRIERLNGMGGRL